MSGVLSLAAAAAILFATSVVTGPSVDALPAAVVAIDAAHGTGPVMVTPSDRIAESIVAAEDGSFYTNNGVDTAALLRASLGHLTGSDAGGSTLEVQLAHLAYASQTSGAWGRVHRVTLGLQMDTHFTKPAILSMYRTPPISATASTASQPPAAGTSASIPRT